jgi:predicted neuraminidase
MKRVFWLFLLVINAAHAQRLVRAEMILAAPPPAVHASTITELPDGRLMAAWFGGSRESAPDVCIYLSVYKDSSWSTPQKMADGNGVACWNPVLFTTRSGRILLFYKEGPNPRQWTGLMRSSTDGGLTWSAPEHLPDNFIGPVKDKPIQLKNGTIFHPSSTEDTAGNWRIHVELSDSTGHQWQYVNINCDTFGVIQPTVLIHKKERLQLLCRSRQNVIVQTWSDDGGKHWSTLTRQRQQNPNSGIDAVTLRNGQHVLIYNPAAAGKDWWIGRNELRVALSTDGVHWKDIYQLEKHDKGEYSYPAVIQTMDGLLHITYTYDRRNIKHVVLHL